MDAMRLINTYKEFFNKDLFRETESLGYRTFTDFCNDSLDTIEYEVSHVQLLGGGPALKKAIGTLILVDGFFYVGFF